VTTYSLSVTYLRHFLSFMNVNIHIDTCGILVLSLPDFVRLRIFPRNTFVLVLVSDSIVLLTSLTAGSV